MKATHIVFMWASCATLIAGRYRNQRAVESRHVPTSSWTMAVYTGLYSFIFTCM